MTILFLMKHGHEFSTKSQILDLIIKASVLYYQMNQHFPLPKTLIRVNTDLAYSDVQH